MIPAAFDYQRAGSVEEAISLLTEHGDEAKLIAGGHSLLPLMKLRLATPSMLIDVGRLTDLSYIRDGGDHVAVGALTRHRDLEVSDLLEAEVPLLKHAASHVGDPQVRHRGTLGGTLAHGDPASDLPAVVLALGGTLVVQGPNGEREIAATDFFHGFLETALQPDELLTEIRIPKTGGRGWSFQKFNRRAQDWAIVGVAAVRTNGSAGIALVNMGSVPLRATPVEAALASGASVADASALAAEGLEPPADLNASTEYRSHLAGPRAAGVGGSRPLTGVRTAVARPTGTTVRKRSEELLVTRRGLILGGLGAAIAVVGGTGVGATTARGRRLLHAARLLQGADHPPPSLPAGRRPTVEYRTLDSVKMRKRVSYAIARPPGGPERVPVVFCLHGRGADDSFAVRVIRFQDHLAAIGARVAVVAPDGGPDNYWHPRRSGENPLGMLVQELVPAVDAELGDGRRGLLGWSMGGYGALLAAERFPDLFDAVALASPALWRRFDETASGAFDDELDFRAHDVFTATDRLDGIDALQVRIGDDDPFVAGFDDLRSLRRSDDFRRGPGFHDAAYWRRLAPEQARFFERAWRTT